MDLKVQTLETDDVISRHTSPDHPEAVPRYETHCHRSIALPHAFIDGIHDRVCIRGFVEFDFSQYWVSAKWVSPWRCGAASRVNVFVSTRNDPRFF